ncbi:hypothetical protein ASPZODRAFT_66941 [Penicilliopsis zonata CBS 506.65]|uniref:protein-histidine N-methyltransferase n=1 Tax=Penicilliopsis zonata CBS 506.65 TaxID=1073090 RepID=A0A1L9SGB9_9EURO|nr:hypothetical protein ASPZODRAFT_66941 [Penicilliopsis zonata CBS 506.65]OJJ46280.1 hypothetical protein ASPZODRAFT_66941 [Penicilliopsis zonata CBS 506.65]
MSGFSFGFSGEDIDVDEADASNYNGLEAPSTAQDVSSLPALVQAEVHDMRDWLSSLPSQISYSTIPIKRAEGDPLLLGRREIFDIRAQLMAEDSIDQDNATLIAHLEEGDITPNFYEGGFKTWECALDLAKLLADENQFQVSRSSDAERNSHVVELGSGTAMPSLALFAKKLSEPKTELSSHQGKTYLTFADYNAAVLRLVTLPNILLTWSACTSQPAATTSDNKDDDMLLDITPELVEAFQTDLAQRGIIINFISGAWSPAFVDLAFSPVAQSPMMTLVLASETIYSPASLQAFTDTLVELLRRSGTMEASTSKAYIAAKRVYFGVGGGVDEFLEVLKGSTGGELAVSEKVDIKSEGVGRVILEISSK